MSDSLKLDKWDVIVSVSSGALTAAMDILWTSDISLTEAHKWGKEETDKFVQKTAKSRGYNGNDTAGAISFLEKEFPIPADELTNDFGGGYHHHLRDFSHHPTIVGLICSILTQFTGVGFGTDKQGNFTRIPISGFKKKGLLESIYTGTIAWGMHMISDVAGSSSSARIGSEGTGLPGPMLSLLKELSSVPGLRAIKGKYQNGNYNFSVECQKLFNGTLLGEHDENGHIIHKKELKFDLRTELGIAYEAINSKQHIPVLLCEGIVCAFYSIRRLINEIKQRGIRSLPELSSLDFSSFLPWKSDTLKHMRMISASAFSVVDITAAGIKAAVNNKGNKSGFALEFMQSVNYIGVLRLSTAALGEASFGLQKLHGQFMALAEDMKSKMAASGSSTEDISGTLKKAVSAAVAIGKVGTPIGFVSAAAAVYDEISKAVKDFAIAYEERIRIEEECQRQLSVIRENREQMELVVSEYMTTHLQSISDYFDFIDEALQSGDTEKFLRSNAVLQEKLGCDSSFSTQDEFDSLMSSDDDFKF